MSGLSVSGIASGIDSDSIISQMVALETRSISTIQRRIALEEAERVLFQDLSSRLESLRASTNAFGADTLFSSLSTTVSDPNVLSVSATDAAPRGKHLVKVLQTALAHRIGGTGIEDPTATPLVEGFTKTIHNNVDFGNITENDQELTVEDDSTYDYSNQVSVNGTYTGDDNINLVVEIVSDFDTNAPDAQLEVKYSLDGGLTFTSENLAVAGGSATLDTGVGFDIQFDNLNGNVGDLADNDQFSFRARGKASIELTLGDGERKEILVESDATLSTLVRAINDDSSLGLRADILNDGSSTEPYRLILTSLTEGRDGHIDILHNSIENVIDLDGVNIEEPAADSSSYTGAVTLDGAYAGGFANTSIVLEMMEEGEVDGTAKFRISLDGGLNFHDNNGDGFNLTNTIDLGDGTLVDDDGDALFTSDPGFSIVLENNNSEFQVGDQVSVDLFDSEIQSAQNALINVNGINLVKSSNTIDDVFEGLTFNLASADPDKTITVNVTEKAGDVTAAVNSFVDSYNSAMSLLHSQSKFNPDEDDSAPLLMGDATVRQVQTSLQRYVTGRISILGGDTISSLADIGITTDSKTGQLSFNSGQLSSALSSDSSGVRRLLSRFGDLVEGNDATFVSSTTATKAGLYEIDVTQARTRAVLTSTNDMADVTDGTERITIKVNKDAQGTGDVISMVVNFDLNMTPQEQLEKIQEVLDTKEADVTAALEDNKLVLRHNQYGDDFKISAFSNLGLGISGTGFSDDESNHEDTGTDLEGKINGITVDSDGDSLIGKNGFAFEDLRIQISNDFTGDAGTIRLNDGLGSSFTKLLDSFVSFDGVLKTRIGSFDSTIDRLESQITRVSERASLLEERLRKRFVNLEVTLGQLNATGSFLTEQLKALPGVRINKR
jgi:flagellar hook-associated protein 2